VIIILRILIVLGLATMGHVLGAGRFAGGLTTQYPWLGALFGFLLGLIVVLIDLYFKRSSVRNILSILLGGSLGLFCHHLVLNALGSVVPDVEFEQVALVSSVIFAYLGAVTILRGQEEFSLMIPFVRLDSKGIKEDIVILDTSVIIDGRVADICETSFLSGKLYLPRFVLKELQLIADSSDPLKRNRGRRGLDILNRMKKSPVIEIKIHEADYPDVNTVDAKLVRLGQDLGGKLLTNDYNLNKVAELQGVKVLNINELANAVKPIVIPGEMMQVRILKEGKEYDQGVGYLDDGTMVVVDNGRKRIGQTISVTITSVLQTQAGRMIFAKPSDEHSGH
jgi:uncharacterized protein YacL